MHPLLITFGLVQVIAKRGNEKEGRYEGKLGKVGIAERKQMISEGFNLWMGCLPNRVNETITGAGLARAWSKAA